MYAVVRQGKLKAGMSAAFVAKAQELSQSMTGKLAGFKAFYVIAGEGDTMCTVSVFETKAQADAAQAVTAQTIQAVIAGMLEAPPTMLAGTIAVAQTF